MQTGTVDVIRQAYETLQAVRDSTVATAPDRAWMFEPMLTYFELVHQGRRRNRPAIWHFLTLPQEPLRALDSTVLAPEFVGGVFAILGMAEKYLDLAAEHMPEHICTLNRFPVGLSLSGDTALPDLMVYAATNPCDAGLVSYAVLEHAFQDIPFYCLDIPHVLNRRAVRYVAEQIQDLVRFIKTKLGLNMDLERLRQLIRVSNQTLDIQRKLFDFQKRKPCPAPSVAHILHGYANLGLPGIQEMLGWYQRQLDWIRQRAEAGPGAVPEEKIRLVWIANNIDFDFSIYEWLEQEYGAVSVACAMGFFSMDPIDPAADEMGIYEGLALRTMRYPMPMNGRSAAEDYIQTSVRLAEEFDADAVVFAANTGCKYQWAAPKLIQDGVHRALGIPVLAFEVSPWDGRIVSTEAIKAKFASFLETAFG